jgi:hypothetical protein
MAGGTPSTISSPRTSTPSRAVNLANAAMSTSGASSSSAMSSAASSGGMGTAAAGMTGTMTGGGMGGAGATGGGAGMGGAGMGGGMGGAGMGGDGPRGIGNANVMQLPDFTGIWDDIMGVLGAGQAETFNEMEAQYALDEQFLENQSREKLGQFNLQGTLAQAEAHKYASEQAAGATKFAATEATRGQIESTRLTAESAERQIGLTGTQERLTQAERFAGEGQLIGLRGGEERRTQAELLAGQERQIGLTGEQERLTQGQRLASEEKQIGLRGSEERLTVETQAREQRETELQQDLFRRYKEQKDASQAQRAFRA